MSEPFLIFMEASQDLARRVEHLELQLSDQDDQLDQMNLTLYRQQQQIDRLVRDLALLRQQVPEGGSTAPRSLRDDIPPHY